MSGEGSRTLLYDRREGVAPGGSFRTSTRSRDCMSLENRWRSRLQTDHPEVSPDTRESVVRWLLGEHPDRWETLEPDRQNAFEAGLNFRYRILQQRYWGVSPEHAYRNLMRRLGSLAILRQKIRTWVATSRDRQRQVVDVLEEVVQAMLDRDRHLQRQIRWIAQCTDDSRLRNALLLTAVEEYCLRPVRNQPLLVYRFVNYLRRSHRGGLTQVPGGEWVKQVSEEIVVGDGDEPISLLDDRALAEYEDTEYIADQQLQRELVKTQFATYLKEKVDPVAAAWLELYLQGYTQEAIAEKLQLPVKQAYRLREKVGYHAVRNFALKQAPELVTDWLGTSLATHRLGLTQTEWQEFWDGLTPTQRQIINRLEAKDSIKAIAEQLNLKVSQVQGEWTKIYLVAQTLRNRSSDSSDA